MCLAHQCNFGWPTLNDFESKSQIFCLRKDMRSKPKQQLDRALSALLITPLTSRNMSLRNTGWRRRTPKISLSKSDISPESGCTIRDPISRKGWRWTSEFLGVEKLISFSFFCRKQTLIRTVTLLCWRLPYCLNVVDIIWAMTLNSCKTVLRHAAQKWCNSFYDRTLQTS